MATPKLSQLPQVPQERGRRSAPNLGAWPRLMRAETDAAYVNERSRRPLPFCKRSKWKKKINGEVVPSD
jgi:hypothetical protein